MREIKFRAWDERCNSYAEETLSWRLYFKAGVAICEFCKPTVLEQYTGIKDSEGKEIYEGDILEMEGFSFKFPVRWCDSSLGFNISWVPENLNKGKIIKVIGNIHENLELSSFK
jgi:hypothetical protein